jgi:hypothetical protein
MIVTFCKYLRYRFCSQLRYFRFRQLIVKLPSKLVEKLNCKQNKYLVKNRQNEDKIKLLYIVKGCFN